MEQWRAQGWAASPGSHMEAKRGSLYSPGPPETRNGCIQSRLLIKASHSVEILSLLWSNDRQCVPASPLTVTFMNFRGP